MTTAQATGIRVLNRSRNAVTEGQDVRLPDRHARDLPLKDDVGCRRRLGLLHRGGSGHRTEDAGVGEPNTRSQLGRLRTGLEIAAEQMISPTSGPP